MKEGDTVTVGVFCGHQCHNCYHECWCCYSYFSKYKACYTLV